MLIVEHALNQDGRDFIIGDIHGAFDLLLDAMDQAGFDKDKDRLFSVGDLIDRGSASSLCTHFLGKPWFHAVRGNHEDMLIDMYAGREPDQATLAFMVARNGFAWWLATPEIIRQEILEAVRKLPLAIEVKTVRGHVGLIHADIPLGMSWQDFTANIKRRDKKTIETCLWGRKRIHEEHQDGVVGIDRVFVGHTPQWTPGVLRLGNIYAIDTGAVFGRHGHEDGGRLTMADMCCCSVALVDSKPVVDLVDLRLDAVHDRPFGKYAMRWNE